MSQIKASIQWTQGVINSDPFKMETSKGQLGLDLLANLLISRFENPKNLLCCIPQNFKTKFTHFHSKQQTSASSPFNP